MIDPWVGVPIRSALGGISCPREVAGHLQHPLLETDIPIQLGVEIGKIEETGEVRRERFSRFFMSPYKGDRW